MAELEDDELEGDERPRDDTGDEEAEGSFEGSWARWRNACVCVCKYIYIYIDGMYVYTYILSIHISISIYIDRYMHMHIRLYRYIHPCIYIYTHSCNKYVYIPRVYVCMYINIQTWESGDFRMLLSATSCETDGGVGLFSKGSGTPAKILISAP